MTRLNSLHARKLGFVRILSENALHRSFNYIKEPPTQIMPAVKRKRASGMKLRSGRRLTISSKPAWKKYKKAKYSNPQGQDEKGASIGVITNQYDSALLYKRKRGGGRRKRKTFQKKVQYAVQSMLGDANLYRSLLGSVTPVAGQQGVIDYSMWGCSNNALDYNHDDLAQALIGYSGSGSNTTQNYIYTSFGNFEFIASNWGSTSLMLKVYTVYAKKDVDKTPANIWATQVTEMPTLPQNAALEGTVVQPTSATPLSTPFQNPDFCRMFTIGEIRKYLLSPGQVASWRETDSRRRKILAADSKQFQFKKGTKFVMLVVHGINTTAVETNVATSFPSCSLNVSIAKGYKYQVLKDNYNYLSGSNNTA